MAEKLLDIKLLEEIKRRRKEARSEGRLVHPEPLLAEIRRKRKRILFKAETPIGLAITRAGDFFEAVARDLRAFDFWTSYVAVVIASRALATVFA